MFLDVFSVKNISDYYAQEIPTFAYKVVAMDEKMETSPLPISLPILECLA